eukprot:5568038-Prymnesium_polylepis.1
MGVGWGSDGGQMGATRRADLPAARGHIRTEPILGRSPRPVGRVWAPPAHARAVRAPAATLIWHTPP